MSELIDFIKNLIESIADYKLLLGILTIYATYQFVKAVKKSANNNIDKMKPENKGKFKIFVLAIISIVLGLVLPIMLILKSFDWQGYKFIFAQIISWLCIVLFLFNIKQLVSFVNYINKTVSDEDLKKFEHNKLNKQNFR